MWGVRDAEQGTEDILVTVCFGSVNECDKGPI